MLSALGDQVLLVWGGGRTGRRAVVRERGQEAGQVCRGRRQVDRGAGVVEFGDVPVLGDGLAVAAPGPADGLQGEAVDRDRAGGVAAGARVGRDGRGFAPAHDDVGAEVVGVV